MGRPVRSSPSTRALVFLVFAIARFALGSDAPRSSDSDGAPARALAPAGPSPPTTTPELPLDFPTIGVRLIAVSLLVILILLLLAWIFLSRRIAAVFRRHFIHDPPPDLVQRASWILENQHQLLQSEPARVDASHEENARNEEKLISSFVSKYQTGQKRRTAEGGKQSLTLFTLRDSAGTSRQDRTGDTRSRAGSEDEFYTPDGSYRGSAFMIPVATSVSGSMVSVATWPLATPLPMTPPTPATPTTPEVPATPAAPATPATGAPTLAVLAAEALAAAAESDSATDTSTITASGTATTTTTGTSVPPTPSTPTDPSPLTSVSVTPTLSRARLQMLSPPLSPNLEMRENVASDPSVDVWLSPQEMSADERTDEEGPCGARILSMQWRGHSAGPRGHSASPPSTYGAAVQLVSDGSVDDWFSTQETADERTDDERLYSAISEDLCGRLLTTGSASASTLALGSEVRLLSNDSMDVWITAPTSPGDKTDGDSARGASANNVQETRGAIRSPESSRPSDDSNVQDPDRPRPNSARKTQP